MLWSNRGNVHSYSENDGQHSDILTVIRIYETKRKLKIQQKQKYYVDSRGNTKPA